jgi:hypothetical protein
VPSLWYVFNVWAKKAMNKLFRHLPRISLGGLSQRKVFLKVLTWLGCGFLLGGSPAAWSYGYQYMKENRERANQAAEKIFVTSDEIIAQIYEPLGPIISEADTEENCLKKIRRQALRKKGEGIIAFKSRETSPGHWHCEGQLVCRIEAGEGVPIKIE